MKTLSQEQDKHLNRLVAIMDRYGFAYDTSITGAGKTIVALKMAKKYGAQTIIIGPPTLRNNWLSEAKNEELNVTFVSNCVIEEKKIIKANTRSFVIVDESHAFKNSSKRTQEFFKMKKDALFTYILFLSATPYDHPRQETIFNSLVGNVSPGLISSRIEFKHKTKVKGYLYHLNQEEKDRENYSNGYQTIAMAAGFDEEKIFKPQIFSSGMHRIHDSLLNSLLRAVEESYSKYKLIICLKYIEHFNVLQKKYPEALVLNGSTNMAARAAIVQKFQLPSWEHRMILVSASVGGVGIDLDDQYGDFPRKIISLPLFVSEYIQLVGRVQRRNTMSDASVCIIQPKSLRTYFKRQLKIKNSVLRKFQYDIVLSSKWEHSKECSSFIAAMCSQRFFGADIAKVISELSCNCIEVPAKKRRLSL